MLELFFNPSDRRIHRTVVKPVAHAKREEVLAAVHRLGIQAEVLQGGARQAFQFDGKEPELVQRVILERVGGHLRLAQVGFLEAVGIDDENAVGF